MPNHFLLVLGEETPFIDPKAEVLDQEYLHVFVHEAWHYWHNVSTIAGFKSFAVTQHLLMHFGDTLQGQADGTSEGSVALVPAALADINALAILRRSLEGNPAPSRALYRDPLVRVHVEGIREIAAEEMYQDRLAPNPQIEIRVRCRWPTGRQEVHLMLLGSYAIEESVTFLIEDQVRAALTHQPPWEAPAFPYQVVPATLEHVTGRLVSTKVAAALGTLALLTTHPGPALVMLGHRFEDECRSGKSDDEAIKVIVATHRVGMIQVFDSVLNDDLPSLVEMHKGRGLLEGALVHLDETIRRAFDRRVEDTLFDLDVVFPTASVDRLMAFHREFPPCSAIQEAAGDSDAVGRDALLRFDEGPEDETGHRRPAYARSLQAQQHFLFAHFEEGAAGASFRSSNAVPPTSCPFYSVCDVSERRLNPNQCRDAPWKAYLSTDGACWYATAVAAALGRVKVGRRVEPNSGRAVADSAPLAPKIRSREP